jgi:biopolymer transport protein ExbD
MASDDEGLSSDFDGPVDRAAGRSHRRRAIEPVRMQLNLTSMIDVIFQLLIYFVITASFAANEGVLATKLPHGGQQRATMAMPAMPLTIDIASAGPIGSRIQLNNEAVAGFSALTERLIKLQDNPKRGRQGAFAPDNPVKIRPHGEVRWQHVVNAFNAAIRAQYEEVAITAPRE